MHERVREPWRAEPSRARGAPVAEHEVLALQRRLGNQAVTRLILARDKTPSRLDVAPVA
jgi:hypothetical protein